MQSQEREQAIRRIRLLVRRTVKNGCSEHEALEAAAAIGKLLAVFRLTIDEINMTEQQCTSMSVNTRRRRYGALDFCMPAIAAFCGTRYWIKHYSGQGCQKDTDNIGIVYTVFGRDGDVEMTGHLYRLLDCALMNEAKAFRRSEAYRSATDKRVAGNSFAKGFCARITQRLETMIAHRRAAECAMPGSTHAIVIARDAMVDAAFAAIREQRAFVTKRARQGRSRDAMAFSLGAHRAAFIGFTHTIETPSKLLGDHGRQAA